MICFAFFEYIPSKIEVPSYYALSEVITDVLKQSEKKLLDSIEKHTTLEEKNLLDELLKPDKEYLTEEKRIRGSRTSLPASPF